MKETPPQAASLAAVALEWRIGNQTAHTAPVLTPFEFAIQQGFRAFEFFPDRGPSGGGGWHERDLDAATRRAIRERAAANGIELSVHAPLEWDPLRPDPQGRLDSTIEFAQAIGAGLLNLHLDVSQGVEAFAASLMPVIGRTAPAGLKLTVENTVWTGPEDFNRFFRVLGPQAPTSGHCGMCFDLGHANLFGPTRNDYWRYWDALGEEIPILHLHLHENWGERDSHLTLFTGPARDNPAGLRGLLARLRQRRYAGCAILEQWPQPPELLVAARDGLRRLEDPAAGAGANL